MHIASFGGGTEIGDACEAVAAIANRLRKPVSATFNGRELKAYPNWDSDDVWEYADFQKWRSSCGKDKSEKERGRIVVMYDEPDTSQGTGS